MSNPVPTPLPTHIIRTLLAAEYTPVQISTMPARDIVAAVLEWEGIIGYTDQVIELVFAAYNHEVPANG